MDAFFIGLLIWCSYTDIKKRTVSNVSVILLLSLGLVHTVLIGLFGNVWCIYPAGLVLAIPFLIVWLNNNIGAGDVKLIMGIGLYLGFTNTLVSFAVMLPLLIVCMIWSWRKNGTIESVIPFAPVIAFGAGGAVILEYTLFF